VGKIDHIVEKNMHRSKTDRTVTKFVISLINIGLKALLVITAAGMIGVKTTSFIAIL
jgi:small conductance mechanosensitive channel